MILYRRTVGLVVIGFGILMNGYTTLTDAAVSGTRIAGTLSCQTVKQEPLPLDAEHGSLLLMEQFACTNKNNGPTDFLSGADVTNQDVAALL